MWSTPGFEPAPHWKGVFPIVRQHCFPYPSPPLLPHIDIEEIILASRSGGIIHSVPHPTPLECSLQLFYLPNSPAVHYRIYKGVDENNSRREIISDLYLDCISMEHVCDQRSKERDITYHKQAVNIKYSDSWLSAFENVHCVGLKIAHGLSLSFYLALVSSNHPKYLHGTDG